MDREEAREERAARERGIRTSLKEEEEERYKRAAKTK